MEASGIPGLVLAAPPVTVAPAGIESLVVGLQLPAEAAQALRGRSAPGGFELTMLPRARCPAVGQDEKVNFPVPGPDHINN